MPVLSLEFDPAIGPVLQVAVLNPSPDEGAARPALGSLLFPALVDTGAGATCISKSVADRVGLKPTGSAEMVSASHAVQVNTYFAKIAIPFGNAPGAPVLARPITVIEFAPPADSPVQILLGRDLICQGHFTIGLDGRFTLAL